MKALVLSQSENLGDSVWTRFQRRYLELCSGGGFGLHQLLSLGGIKSLDKFRPSLPAGSIKDHGLLPHRLLDVLLDSSCQGALRVTESISIAPHMFRKGRTAWRCEAAVI